VAQIASAIPWVLEARAHKSLIFIQERIDIYCHLKKKFSLLVLCFNFVSQLLSDRLLSAMADLGPSGLAKAAEAFLRFAAADKGDAVRRIERRQPSTSKSAAGPASVAGEVVGGSDETKALVSFADHLIKLLANQACSSKSELRFGGCRLLGHAFQLLTGLLVTCTPSCAFAESSGGKVFDVGAREADGDEDAKCSDLVTQLGLEGSKASEVGKHREAQISNRIQRS